MQILTPAVLLPAVCLLARQAGNAILSVYHSAFSFMRKKDGSPVTKADQIAEKLILTGLQRLVHGIPVVAEESFSVKQIRQRQDFSVCTFWLVDPLDGTEAFIRHTGEFTVNIALIQKQKPVLGVIYAPVYNHLYSAVENRLATLEICEKIYPLKAFSKLTNNPVIVVSRTHDDPNLLKEFLHSRKLQFLIRVSSSLKLCLVATGQANFYPRFGRTMEWDTAAGHAILNAAGGHICTMSGKELHYGKFRFQNPHFIAYGTTSL